MAAEAPITAKKGEYSGLSSEDILALFPQGDTATEQTDFSSGFPLSHLGLSGNLKH